MAALSDTIKWLGTHRLNPERAVNGYLETGLGPYRYIATFIPYKPSANQSQRSNISRFMPQAPPSKCNGFKSWCSKQVNFSTHGGARQPNKDHSNATQCTVGDDEALKTLKSARNFFSYIFII